VYTGVQFLVVLHEYMEED